MAEKSKWLNSLSSLLDDHDSTNELSYIIDGLNQKRGMLETREIESKSKLRSKIPNWPRKIKRKLTPQKLVANSVDRFFEDQIEIDPQTVAELRTLLMFLE